MEPDEKIDFLGLDGDDDDVEELPDLDEKDDVLDSSELLCVNAIILPSTRVRCAGCKLVGCVDCVKPCMTCNTTANKLLFDCGQCNARNNAVCEDCGPACEGQACSGAGRLVCSVCRSVKFEEGVDIPMWLHRYCKKCLLHCVGCMAEVCSRCVLRVTQEGKEYTVCAACYKEGVNLDNGKEEEEKLKSALHYSQLDTDSSGRSSTSGGGL